jgi:transposase-like protein
VSLSSRRRRILDRWDRSGLSAAAFAPAVGVSPWTLYAWRRRKRELAAAATAVDARSSCTAIVPAFVELAIDDSAAPAPPQCSAPIEIALPRGLAVRVLPGFDAGTLRRVVDALVA